MEYLYLYLLLINIVAFIVFGLDKRALVNRRTRISDQTLFVLAAIGGSVGALVGLVLFGNKRGEQQYILGIPVILVIQVIAIALMSNVVA